MSWESGRHFKPPATPILVRGDITNYLIIGNNGSVSAVQTENINTMLLIFDNNNTDGMIFSTFESMLHNDTCDSIDNLILC